MRNQNAAIITIIALVMGAEHSGAFADELFVPGGFGTIQLAIDAADPGDTITVAPGTYAEAIDYLGKALVIRSTGGAAVTTIDASGLDTSAVSCVLSTGDAALRGFSVTGGSGSLAPGGPQTFGGGLHLELAGSASFTVRECEIGANDADAGGGVSAAMADQSVLIVLNAMIVENSALAGDGGGMYLVASSGTATALLSNVQIGSNHAFAGSGGAVYAEDLALLRIDAAAFDLNSAQAGGAVFAENCNVTVRAADFTDNDATETVGGALALFGNSAHQLNIYRSTFAENSAATLGGGAYFQSAGGVARVINCDLRDNAALRGGAIYTNMLTPPGIVSGTSGGQCTIVNSVLAMNHASDRGGGLYSHGSGSGSTSVINSTLYANDADVNGGGVLNNFADGATLNLRNSIIRANTPNQIAFNNGGVTATWCNVQGGFAGAGNINTSPGFVNEGAGDYRLAAGSACIDAANNASVPADAADLDGDGNTSEVTPLDLALVARFVDDPDSPNSGNGTPPLVDIGAYEFQIDVATCTGDIDEDGEVDFDDFTALLAQFGSNCPCPADLDGDGDVDFDDFVALLANWGDCP